MISLFNASLFNGNQLFTFAKLALVSVEPLRPSVPALAPFIDRVINSKINFQAALERESKNPFTPLISAADGDCDDAFMAFRGYAEAASFRKLEGWNTAANKILEVIRHYGWTAYGMGYRTQIAAENKMFSELKNKCTAEMATIAATEWFNEFEAAELAFETVYHQGLSTTPSGLTVVETRPVLVAALKSLFAMISLLNSGDPIAELTAVETDLNQHITNSVASAKAAKTREENAKKEEETKGAQNP